MAANPNAWPELVIECIVAAALGSMNLETSISALKPGG
jgi:hypothetical protein